MNGLAGIPNIRRTILFVFRYMEIVCKFVGWNCGIDRNPINSVIFKFSFNHKSMFKDKEKKWKKKIPVFHSAVPSEIDIPSVTSAEVSASSRSDRQINRRLTAARPAHLSTFIVWFSYHLPVQLFSSQTWNVEYILLKTEIMWKLPEQLPFIDYEPHVAHKFHVTSYGYSLDKVNNRPVWPLSLSFTLNSSSCVWITCNVEDQPANTLSFQVHSSGNCVSG